MCSQDARECEKEFQGGDVRPGPAVEEKGAAAQQN